MAANVSTRVISRHTQAIRMRFDVRANNLNAWCRLPGNPFAAGLTLMPNAPQQAPVAVSFGPLLFPDEIDTLTCLLYTQAAREHPNRVSAVAEILSGEEILDRAEATLGWQGDAVLSLNLKPTAGGHSQLRLGVDLETDTGDDVFPGVSLCYLLAYANNPLAELCNAVGSDKGTEHGIGAGVPHCYALEYFNLFSAFREDSFSLLEIGLQNSGAKRTAPDDVPSLRVWHDFFPSARCFGYDIIDFSRFAGDRMVTFQGDQGSRRDLGRFLETHDWPLFRVVIDDGSHASSDQQVSLGTLFPRVQQGGLYIIEDLNWQPYPESQTTLETLRAYLEGGRISSPHLSEGEARYLQDHIESVQILRPNDAELAVLRKR
ncbi:MAG: hypothetical protein M3454_15385 [Actinomycetota bacterium]|nr:hypothetical protein [Actinomycetota bacterium]